MSSIESESLPAHVSICQQRYQALEHRLVSVERHVDEIHRLIGGLHDKVDAMGKTQVMRWDRAQIGIIALLSGLIAHFLTKALF